MSVCLFRSRYWPKSCLAYICLCFTWTYLFNRSLCFARSCLAHTLYRKSNLCIPRNETARPGSHYLHSCIYERFIYSPGSVCLFGCNKIGRLILGIHKSLKDTWMWKLGDRTLYFCFGNIDSAQFHFWEYINRNQTLIMDSQQPFICSAAAFSAPRCVCQSMSYCAAPGRVCLYKSLFYMHLYVSLYKSYWVLLQNVASRNVNVT